MSEIREHVLRANFAFDEKFVNNPTLPEQKTESGKRKRESEAVFPRKKVRLQNRVSENFFH